MTSIAAVCNAVGRMSAALMLMLAADACAQPTYPSKAIRPIRNLAAIALEIENGRLAGPRG
jgi:hypothetical protein